MGNARHLRSRRQSAKQILRIENGEDSGVGGRLTLATIRAAVQGETRLPALNASALLEADAGQKRPTRWEPSPEPAVHGCPVDETIDSGAE